MCFGEIDTTLRGHDSRFGTTVSAQSTVRYLSFKSYGLPLFYVHFVDDVYLARTGVGTDSDFDFGLIYGSTHASPTRQIRSSTLLRDLAADHKLTKHDLMLTLSDHSYGEDPHEPYQRMPHWDGNRLRATYLSSKPFNDFPLFLGPCVTILPGVGTEIDEHTESGGLSASSMVPTPLHYSGEYICHQ